MNSKEKMEELIGLSQAVYDWECFSVRDLITLNALEDHFYCVCDEAYNMIQMYDVFPFDEWVGIKKYTGIHQWDYDLHLFVDEDGEEKAILYPVVGGETDTSVSLSVRLDGLEGFTINP